MIVKVIFAGTPDFAADALKAIVAAGFDVSLVLTRADQPKGRGMKMQASAVKTAALELNLPIAQPLSLKDVDVQAMLAQEEADVMVVAAYGMLLPQAVLDIPKLGCLNIHASLLPRWRGAAPIQRAIEAGDEKTGVCIMQMDAGLDTGAILLQKEYTIAQTDTANEVHDGLMHLGATAIVATLQQLSCLKATPQAQDGVTYAAKLSKADARLSWQDSAVVLARKVRAFNPVPAAWTLFLDQPLKIWQAQVVEGKGEPGEILAANEHGLVVATGQDALCITELQAAGSKRMGIAAFLAGRSIQLGERLV